MTLGYVFELAGLATAALGLWKTYEDRPRGQALTGDASLDGLGAVTTTSDVDGRPVPELSRDERLTVLEERVAALERGTGLIVEAEASDRRTAVHMLIGRIGELEVQAREFTRSAVTKGVPIAAAGLGLAMVGLFAQGVATAVTWGC